MKTLGYYNGVYGELDAMQVPMNDRACSFGDGLYDSAYARNGIVYSLHEHINRMYRGADELGIHPPCSQEELNRIIHEMVQKVDANEVFVYWQLSRGTMPRSHACVDDLTANLWIIIQPMSIRDTYKKIRLLSREDTRFLHCHIKTLNLIPSVLAATAAKKAGLDECVFHRNGRVTECAHSNIQFLKGHTLVTPPADHMILAGIQRGHLMAKCREFGLAVEERPFMMEEMLDADEIIVSSAGSMCLSVCEIDGKAVGGKNPALLKKLQDALLGDFLAATEPQ
ncbi:MAG: aminotransferase class IV [Clostridia bacterium]|nr:aminotransferase class IV [Clostridia bacterium]